MQTRLANALSLVGREALRIVLPSGCVVCDGELPWRQRVASCCASCWASLAKIGVAKCRSCAQLAPSTNVSSFLCFSCAIDPLPVDWCDAWGEYRGGLERLLQALKFERQDFLDEPLAGLLEETLATRGDLAFDVIAPVPMTRGRERRRGYNQAELLARALARRVAIPCDTTLLEKRGERERQSRLPKIARAENVRRAFEASPRAKGKSILLIDDICTTGETFRACASALVAREAARVCALAVAKAS